MTIKEFIEAAIEGGWDYNKNSEYFPNNIEFGSYEYGYPLHCIFLDPKAWKAVGKVKGWNESDDDSNESHCGACGYYCSGIPESLNKMRGMIRSLYEDGKNLEEYIATL